MVLVAALRPQEIPAGLTPARAVVTTDFQSHLIDHNMNAGVLENLLVRRRECLQSLAVLGARQLELIEAEEISELLNLLVAKQNVVGQLQEVESQLQPFRGTPLPANTWASPADRARCAALITECDRMYADIMTRERSSEEQLRARRDAVAARLGQTCVAGQARNAYSQDDRIPRQLDLTVEH